MLGVRINVCSIVAGLAGFRRLRGNAARAFVGKCTIEWAKTHDAKLVVFPVVSCERNLLQRTTF